MRVAILILAGFIPGQFLFAQGTWRPSDAAPANFPPTIVQKGVGWRPSRAAVIDSSGKLTAATGNLTDCIRVDGSSGGCSGGGGTGSVTSVAITVPSWLSVAGSPITGSGTFVITTATGQLANRFLATPSGTTGAVSLRPIVAADLPTTTVNVVTSDTNIVGSISGQTLTLGWAGTLSAGRLNSNVVQTIANDTNITGSITSQTLTLGWTGTLAKNRQNAATVYNDASNTWSAGTQDFSGAAHTLPAKSGLAASKPATCTVGEEFFATDATAGQNKYYCTASNTWTQQSGGGGGGSISTIAAGSGVTVTGGTGPAATISADTATMASRINVQAGTSVFVTETSSSGTTYTGTMNPTLTAYTTGQALVWKFSTSCTAGAVTINIDTLGAKSLKLYDGSTNPAAADCASGTVRTIKYDGTVFRLDGGPSSATSTTAQIPLEVGGCNVSGAGGIPAWNATGIGYNCGANTMSLDFTSAGSVYAFRFIRWPSDWAFGTAAVAHITVSQTGGVASGNFKFDVSVACGVSSPDQSAATYNTAGTTGSFAAPTNSTLTDQVTGSIDTTSCTQNGFAIVKLKRDSTVGSNSSLSAQVLNVSITH